MRATFASEADLCRAFIAALPEEWTAYPETSGFDILLVRADGFQVGVEAKLRLNAKVVTQAAEHPGFWATSPGPDCRAVLIPSGVSDDLASLCRLLGIVVIRMSAEQPTYGLLPYFNPHLPNTTSEYDGGQWPELCPDSRLAVPNWVPDVVAGASAPVSLTPWKVKAIKLHVLLARRGFVTRKDFAYLKLDMSLWTQRNWLIRGEMGKWVAGPAIRDLRAQHPTNFAQIEGDWDKWRAPDWGRDNSDII